MDNIVKTDNELWKVLSESSDIFEKSLDKLYKKQTGSYYTSLELTYLMMQDLVRGLDEGTRRVLYQKRFLEPCVGTGNFVFAYLRVCRELGFTNEQNIELLNNIYACDINRDALDIYKNGLKRLAKDYFGIYLDEAYFDSHIGSGLLFDVQAADIQYIPINTIFDQSVIKNGFDIVVTNPPYKNFRAEKSHYTDLEIYETDRKRYDEIGKLANYYFSYAVTGTINLYKLFVEEILDRYLSPKGVCALLIPASILSDKTCAKLRTHIIETMGICSLRLIPEDSKYVDASQALCAMLLHKGGKTDTITIGGSIGKQEMNMTNVRLKDIISEKTGNAILVLTNNEYRIRNQMLKHPVIQDIPYIQNLRGELDLTLNKKYITAEKTPYFLYRGRNISQYKLLMNDVEEYVSEAFLQNTAKQNYIKKERLICQQIANMKKERRVSFAIAPENSVLGNSCNFISVDNNKDGIDLFFLLGVLNSSLINWYFKLTSSNNHINNYEIDMFPIPVDFKKKKELSDLVKKYLKELDENLLVEIDLLVYKAYGVTETLHGQMIERNMSVPEDVLCMQENVQDRFLEDLRFLIPGIAKEDCVNILNGQASVQDVGFRKNMQPNRFEKKVLESVERKYRKKQKGLILNHTTFKLSDLDLEMIRSVPQGGNWKNIPQETIVKSKRLMRITETGGRTTLYGRIDYSKPSYTITTYFNRPGNGTYVHPVHERVISVREAARFQSFPDDYMFCGNKSDLLKQVGNAVPVILAYCIGKTIREKMDCKTSVDLFSGAGGMTLGFKHAGIHAAVANDIEENACVTLKVNNPEIPVICGDITDEKVKSQLIEAGLDGKADIICGGPPCQGFSMAGFRMKDDPRNELFRHFVDIVSSVNPKVIVFENVEGLLSFQKGETYRNIIELFSELGYHTEGKTLMANHYGVPQKRKRVIILCTRKDIGVLPSELFPEPITAKESEQVTAYDTIADLEKVLCAEEACYTNEYSSDISRYFRGSITIDEYLSAISNKGSQMQKQQKQVIEPEQLTLF